MKTAASTNKPLRHFHPVLLKLIQKNAHFDSITDRKLQQFIVDQIAVDDKTDIGMQSMAMWATGSNPVAIATHYLPSILQTIHECVLDNIQLAKLEPNQAHFTQDSTHRLSWFASSIPYLIMKKYPNVAISEGCYSLIRSIFQIKGTPLPSYMLDIPEFTAITIPIQTCQHVR